MRDKKGNSVKKKVNYVKTLVDCEDEPEYDTFHYDYNSKSYDGG